MIFKLLKYHILIFVSFRTWKSWLCHITLWYYTVRLSDFNVLTLEANEDDDVCDYEALKS